MSVIDNAKKHFAEQDVKVIEVPEWGEDDKPLRIFSKPLTLAETSKLYKMSKEDDLTMMAYVLIYKALDENGDKLFDLGDKNALLIAARVLGYGKDYEFNYGDTKETIDLTQLKEKDFDSKAFKAGKNEFTYTLPTTGVELTYKLLTHGDEAKIQRELTGLRKINKDASPDLSTRLKYMITAVNGDAETKTIRDFVDNQFLARDSRSFRKHIENISPDVDMRFYPENGPEEGVTIPIGVTFLWPDAAI